MSPTPPTTTARDRLGRRARVVAAMAVAVSGGLLLLSLVTARHNRLPTGGGLGADYLAFYDAGDLLNRFGPGRLYDLVLQSDLYHQRLAGEPADVFLPFAYAPQVAAACRPLARLPYAGSYLVWTVISTVAFAVAVAVAVWAARLPRAWWSTVAWVAAGFEPFAFECVHGGQVSTVAAMVLSIAAALAVAGWPVLAGVAVGCCCYKPTLLAVLVPGLIVTRRWRALTGCAAAVAGWAVVDLLAFGFGPCRAYLALLAGYAGRGALEFRTAKFVDVHSFSLLLGASSWAAAAAVFGTMAIALRGLRPIGSADDERLFWAAALAWTPVANLYAGSYDAVLAVPAAVLAAGVVYRRYGQLPTAFVVVGVACWVSPWVTSAVAGACGVQVFTVALMGLAVSVGWNKAADGVGGLRPVSAGPPMASAALLPNT